MRIITEPEFRAALAAELADRRDLADVGSVTGPGRSGAVCAVYVSHALGVPFIPFGAQCPRQLGTLLICDTARQSGKTLRKAVRRYQDDVEIEPLVVFEEPPRVAFWYEAPKPQRYRHENDNDNDGRMAA